MDNATREALLNDFAKRCFRNMADRDYVHARLAYRSKLVSQFLSSSLHCLEKYAKAILLFNRVDGTRQYLLVRSRNTTKSHRQPIRMVTRSATSVTEPQPDTSGEKSHRQDAP